MIKNLIFDFDGVIVDSEFIIAKSMSKYLSKRNIIFDEKDFFNLAGNKTVEIISILSNRFKIQDQKSFYDDIMLLSKDMYSNKLETISGVEEFLKNTNHKRLIGSNNTKPRIIEVLKRKNLDHYFNEKFIFSFDIVGIPKPDPAIYVAAVEESVLKVNETIIIEDSPIGVKAGVDAGIRVIGITAGSHWYEGRSDSELFEAGAYEVVNNYKDMLLLINKL